MYHNSNAITFSMKCNLILLLCRWGDVRVESSWHSLSKLSY